MVGKDGRKQEILLAWESIQLIVTDYANRFESKGEWEGSVIMCALYSPSSFFLVSFVVVLFLVLFFFFCLHATSVAAAWDFMKLGFVDLSLS